MDDEPLPQSLTLDDAYRAAFYMVLAYYERGGKRDEQVILLLQYLWTDPARWDDWTAAVHRALNDGGLANPDHEGLWQGRPEWPS